MATDKGSRPAVREPHPRAWQILERKQMTVGRAAWIISLATFVVMLGGAVLIRVADKKDFHDLGDGLWWSIQTVTTVGYGDIVPTNTLGRLIASLVMLTGIAFLTVITATITSTFVETARSRAEGATHDELTERLDQISTRLGTIEAGLTNSGERGGGHTR